MKIKIKPFKQTKALFIIADSLTPNIKITS
jgi:hypothetical protein